MEPLSAMGLAASIIAIIQITQTVLKKVGPSAHNKRDLNRLLSLASGFKGVYESLEYSLTYSEHDESRAALLKSLEQPARECKLVLQCIREHLENTNFVRQYIIGSHFDEKFKRCIERLKDERNLFEMILQVDQHAMMREIKKFSTKTGEILILVQNTKDQMESLTKVSREQREEARAYFSRAEATLEEVHTTFMAQKMEQEEAQKDATQESLIGWLSNTCPLSDHSMNQKKRESTTGNWFIKGDAYKKWLCDPGSVLWLPGNTGCGKSVLCSTIIEETKAHCSADLTQSSYLAYYYFSFSDSEKQKPANFLRSIIAQLVSQTPDVPDALRKLRESYRKDEPPLEALMLVFRSVVQVSAQFYLILDAIDECPASSGMRDQLCEILVEVGKWPIPKLQIIATSRPAVDIEKILSKLTKLSVVPIQSSAVDEDIRLYVKSRMANDNKLRFWTQKIEDIETSLVSRSNGSFQWVSCQIEKLNKCKTRNEIRQALATLPKTLETSYQRILDDICEEDHFRVASALRWLVFSQQPLSVEELAEASIIDPNRDSAVDEDNRLESPTDILQLLSGLVSTYHEDHLTYSDPEEKWLNREVVKIAHFSIQEYLLSDHKGPRLREVFQIEEFSSQRLIAESCLLYIDFVRERCEYDTPAPWDLEGLYPLESYASRYWPHHVGTCETMGNTPVNLLCRCLNSESWRKTWNSQADCALYHAADLNLETVLERLVETTPLGYDFSKALVAACWKGNETTIKLLLDAGTDVNEEGSYSMLPIEAACEGRRENIAKLLLKNGADVNEESILHDSILDCAVRGGDLSIIKLMLDNGAKVETKGEEEMVQAEKVQDYELIAQLLIARMEKTDQLEEEELKKENERMEACFDREGDEMSTEEG